jgi:hypothetical protein
MDELTLTWAHIGREGGRAGAWSASPPLPRALCCDCSLEMAGIEASRGRLLQAC